MLNWLQPSVAAYFSLAPNGTFRSMLPGFVNAVVLMGCRSSAAICDVMVVILLFANAPSLIEVTVDGIVNVVIAQPLNAFSSIVVR